MNHSGGTSAKAFSPFNKYGERFTMTPADPILLSDEQIRQYIANGYVQIETDVPAHIPATIARKLDELVAAGWRLWEERAHLGDLEAIRARSRVTEAKALLDPTGLGGFTVLEWVCP